MTAKGFEPREGFNPRGLTGARRAQVWYSPVIARWEVERSHARQLADGAALGESAVGSPEWLVGEIFHHRGEAVVLEPPDLRERIAERAAELVAELTPARPPAKA